MIDKVYPYGTKEILVAAAEKIAVYNPGPDAAKVYELLTFTNHPPAWNKLGEVISGETVFGAFTNSTTVRIDSGADAVVIATGTAPSVNLPIAVQGAPTAKTVAATLTAAELLTKIITGTHTAGANQDYTLPTGTLLDAAVDFQAGDSFEWSLINLSAAAADTVTVAAGSGHTVVGVMVVQSAHATTGGLYGNAARFLTRKTAANTFVTYRIS